MEVDTTSTPAVETPVAAPAISEPSATPAAGQRPASFQKAFEQIAAKEPAPDPAKATAATTPAGTVPVPSAEPQKLGAPPEERWPSILENQRKDAWNQAIQARDQQWQEKAGWVLQLPPDRQEAARSLVTDFYANPAMFIANIYASLANHPQWGPQLRALIGGGNGNGHTPVTDEPQPDVEIIVNPQTGQTVRSYSAEQLAKREAWLTKQNDQRFEQRLAPFEQERRAAQERAKQAEWERESVKTVDTYEARIMKILDGRSDLAPKVADLLGPGVDPIDAALQVREQHLKPQQQQQATATAADTMRRKAAANTANGSGAPVTPMTRPKNPKELAALMEQMDRG